MGSTICIEPRHNNDNDKHADDLFGNKSNPFHYQPIIVKFPREDFYTKKSKRRRRKRKN